MADSPALWLWLDTETSGLLDSRPAVLEIAWMHGCAVPHGRADAPIEWGRAGGGLAGSPYPSRPAGGALDVSRPRREKGEDSWPGPG